MLEPRVAAGHHSRQKMEYKMTKYKIFTDDTGNPYMEPRYKAIRNDGLAIDDAGCTENNSTLYEGPNITGAYKAILVDLGHDVVVERKK